MRMLISLQEKRNHFYLMPLLITSRHIGVSIQSTVKLRESFRELTEKR